MTVASKTAKVSISQAESLVKLVRLLATSGRSNFHNYLISPLLYASWKRDYSSESSHKMMVRIERQAEEHPNTIAPHAKRLVGQALTETPSAVGNASIFFLEMSIRYHQVSVAPETLEFVHVVEPPIRKFEAILTRKTSEDFEVKLADMTPEEIEAAFRPVELGRKEETVRLNQEARILFEKIKRANQKDDMPACRKLIANYLIRFADEDDNNRDQIEQLIDALEQRAASFRKELHDFMAIELFYRISQGIAKSDLKKTIQGIRKYAFIFEGDSGALYHKDIDRLEKKLYAMIREKGLMKQLIRSK
ncbi:MAG: hypothetical protein KDK23_04430 [Leptospiraceae bacterium]|nr:hypothetical protein [Leptospiraceae bacterium]